MMLAEEDRKIIKEAGQLRAFLQDLPSVIVDNNLVKLNDNGAHGKMEESTNLNMLNTSRRPTIFSSWSCENCGFSNSLNVQICKRCHSAIKEFEQSTTRFDYTLESKDSDASFLSENDSFYDDSLSTEYKEIPFEANESSLYGKAEETSSDVEPNKEYVCKVMEKLSLHKSSDISQPPERKSYEDEKYEEFNKSVVTHTAVCGDSGEKRMVDRAVQCMCNDDHEELMERNLKEEKQALADHKETMRDPVCVPDSSENFDDSGIKDFVFSNKLVFENTKSVVVQDQNESCDWLNEEPMTSDCSVSDVNDDPFCSLQSGSFYSLCSNSSSPDSFDDPTEIYFEELEDLPGHLMYDRLSPPEHLQCAHVYPSMEMKNTVVNAVNIDLSTVHKSVKDVSCITDLSGLIRHEKASQTVQVNTRHECVNTDLSLPETLMGPQLLTGSRGGDGDRFTGLGLHSSSIKALTQRVIKAELHALSMQLWLCRHLCWKRHQQSVEKRCIYGITKVHEEQMEEATNLQASLAELEEKYKSMKAQILSGVPLDTMTPLCMQLTTDDDLTAVSNTYATSSLSPISEGLSPWERLLLYGCSSDSSPNNKDDEESKTHTDGQIDVTQEVSTTQNIHSDSDLACCPLPAATEDGSCIVDVNEQWVDAEETLNNTVPGKPESQMILEPKQSEPSNKQKKWYVCVRNVAATINETDLISHFEKYQISSVFIEELFKKSSYAILTFSSLDHAEAAVREMNGKELCGRGLKVNLIKDAKSSASLNIKPVQKASETKSNAGQLSNSESLASNSNTSQNNTIPATNKVPATISGCLPVTASNQRGCGSYTAQKGHSVSPLYPVKVPNWNAQYTPSFVPFIPPWMMQLGVTKLPTYNSTPSQVPLSYSAPPFWMPSTSAAPWDSVTTQAFYAKAKPMTYQSRHVAHSKVISSTFNKDVNIPAQTALPKVDPGTSGSGFDFYSQNERTPLGSKSTILHSETNAATAVKQTFNVPTVEMTRVSYASSYASPNIKPPSTYLTSLFPTTSKAITTVSPSITACVNKVANDPSYANRSKATLQVTKPTHEKGLSGSVTTATSADLPISTKTFENTSCPNPNTDAGRPAPTQIAPEDWSTCPRLDRITEFPTFIVPNRLNLFTFNKVMKHLVNVHPEASRVPVHRV
uniref:RRM domain-containing protein n=1 Tax=Leptobrachium leishanense TaxID=445787 RepID=A0A8C5MZ49_9ANUR